MISRLAPLVLIVVTLTAPPRSTAEDAGLLLKAIDAVQQPLEDFRCEYEGTIRGFGPGTDGKKTGPDGLVDTFIGNFIWKRGGDTLSDGFHRLAADDSIVRETLAVRVGENRSESHRKSNAASLGQTDIGTPATINTRHPGCLGGIFLLDDLRRRVVDPDFVGVVSEEATGDETLKVVSFSLKDVPNSLTFRYWINLLKGGHVVRWEAYQPGEVMDDRVDVKLARWRVGASEIWMPVEGVETVYMAIVEKRVIRAKEPTLIATTSVVDGTMEFNKGVKKESFTLQYRPGTPVSDHLKQVRFEYGRQKISADPTKSEARAMLERGIAEAEAMKSELVVAPEGDRPGLSRWLVPGFGLVTVFSLIILWISRRGR